MKTNNRINESINKNTVLLLGSGAIKIGEAGEFDYSGSQAIKALKEEGKKIILINPNIATIQTSENMADEVYFLPVTPYFVEKVIKKEKPESIILSFGGQTALNCGLELDKLGILEKYNTSIIGTPVSAIKTTEDRELFSESMSKLGILPAKGKIVKSVSEGLDFAQVLGLPVMLRAGFALGGSGSGIAYDKNTLKTLLENAFVSSSQVIIEECLYGWKELEYEVVRDKNDNCIVVCTIENFDPVGIHTGESIVVSPAQTLNNEEYFMLRELSIRAIRQLGIIGECNIQFALNPKSGEVRVIEVNARLSRSSALASKATGYPLAYVAAKLALGKTLPELRNNITLDTSAFFEPALDYIVVKMPRWDLDKFDKVNTTIGSEMKSVGEVMSIGRNFCEAIQKATRMLSDGYEGVVDVNFSNGNKNIIIEKLKKTDTMRLFTICSALLAGVDTSEICEITGIDKWFIYQLQKITEMYKSLNKSKNLSHESLLQAKQLGFSDIQIADLKGQTEMDIRKIRKSYKLNPHILQIDTMAGEFPAKTNYLYTTYSSIKSDYVPNINEKKVAVLGCGPYSIGTSVEFDWCAVNTILEAQKNNFKTVTLNCNPETVSTDFDVSDYLYFETLSFESVSDILEMEKCPVIVSVGGQIPNNISFSLSNNNHKILGTKPENIYKAEHRKSFSKMLDELHIKQPEWKNADSVTEARNIAKTFNFPILVRPSFVLSGKGMSVIDDMNWLEIYLENMSVDIKKYPLVITKFIDGARECDVDGVAKDGDNLIYAMSTHIEGGGVHSGDSTLIYPSPFLSNQEKLSLKTITEKIIKALNVNGPYNIQYLLTSDEIYVIECNLRASRSVPFVSKVTGVNFISIASKVLFGSNTENINFKSPKFFGVKAPQFSYHKLRGADPITSVEMHSTGESAGLGKNVYEAYLKAMIATGFTYPSKQTALFSLGGRIAKLRHLEAVKKLYKKGYKIFATTDTSLFLREHGIDCTTVGKIYEGVHPNVQDLFSNKIVDFALIIPEKRNSVSKSRFDSQISDSYLLRRLSVDKTIPFFTDSNQAEFFIDSILNHNLEDLEIKSWKGYLKN